VHKLVLKTFHELWFATPAATDSATGPASSSAAAKQHSADAAPPLPSAECGTSQLAIELAS
jgi:hypothetical protein